jgi:hypothetical protein
MFRKCPCNGKAERIRNSGLRAVTSSFPALADRKQPTNTEEDYRAPMMVIGYTV